MPETVHARASLSDDAAAAAGEARVAIVTNVIPPYHKPILDRLAQRYPRLRVLLSTPMESNRSWNLEWENLDVIVQKTVTLNRQWRHPKGFNEPLYVHFPIDTFAQLRRFRADLVISWEMGARTMLSAAYRWTRTGARLIVWAEIAESTEHGRGWIRNAIRRVLHYAADAFIVTGESGARYLRSLGVAEQKIFKVAYTTDINRFVVCPLVRAEERGWSLLYVGQLIERKGLMEFLAVLSRWANQHSHRNVEFVLAGDGPLRKDLERFPAPRNLKVLLLGNVDYRDLPRIYARAGIFVLPSLADTWGVVVNEALASGLPVLGSVHAQAVSELVEDGVNGWTFRPEDGDAIYAALERALHTSWGQLEGMRQDARATAARLTPDYVTGLVDRAIHFVRREPN